MALVMQKPMHQAKMRLSHWLTPDERIGLAESMLFDVLNTLSKVPSLDGLGIVTSDDRAMALAREFGVHIFGEKEALGMNEAVKFVVDVLPKVFQQLFILPADLPLISAVEIDHVVKMVQETPVIIIPCRKGTGTNGLLLSPPGVISTAFGLNSKDAHCRMAKTTGIKPAIFSRLALSCDIDTVEDLILLRTKGEGTRTREYLESAHIFDKLLMDEVSL